MACLIKRIFSLGLIFVLVASCTISYQFNGASINYDRVKTITIENFPIRSAYVYAPLGTEFNNKLQDTYSTQTRLQFVDRDGDLHVSGEITGYDQLNQAVKSDGFSSVTQLRVTVNVRFVNNTNHSEDFERQFSAFRDYESSYQLVDVQDELLEQIIKEITEQIFNATVANW